MIEYLYNFTNRLFANVLLLISEWYNYFKRTMRHYLPEQSILLYDKKTSKFVDFYYRFQLIKFIHKIADFFDIDSSMGHIVVHDKVSQKEAIICEDTVSLTSLIPKSKDLLLYKKDALVFMVIKLEFKKGDTTLCLKEIFKNYLHAEDYQNTIHNIFLLNEIEYDDNDEINIKFFKNGKHQEKVLKMKDFKTKHIKNIFET